MGGSGAAVSEGAGGAALAVPVTAGRVLVWRRFRREKLAVAALAILVLIVLACFVLEPILEHLLGRTPDTPFLTATNQLTHKPVGPWTWVGNQPLDASAHGGKTLFVLGADGPLGRDEFLRVLAGGRVSLEVALFATLVGLTIGVLFGTIAGWYGGSVDALVSRLTELVMAFPLLLLVIAIGQTIADRFDNITAHGAFEPGVLSLGVVIGFFSWFYPARVCRVLVQELSEREFVEAARMIGQSDWRILRKHILPHLIGPITVWAGLMAATVIVLEAALSSLNFGIRLPTASWGSLLSATFGNLFNFNPYSGAAGYYQLSNWPLVWPSVALFLTVLCLALISDGLRSALGPGGES